MTHWIPDWLLFESTREETKEAPESMTKLPEVTQLVLSQDSRSDAGSRAALSPGPTQVSCRRTSQHLDCAIEHCDSLKRSTDHSTLLQELIALGALEGASRELGCGSGAEHFLAGPGLCKALGSVHNTTCYVCICSIICLFTCSCLTFFTVCH